MTGKVLSVAGLIDVVTLLLLSTTMLSLFGEHHYLLELLSHLKNLYFGIALVLLALFFLRKNKQGISLALLCVLVNGQAVMPLYFAAENPPVSDSNRQVSVLLSNVYTHNPQHQKLLDLVLQESPDILVLQEIDTHWMERLAPLFVHYPHRTIEPRNDNFGIAVLSKIQPVKLSATRWGSLDLPSVEGQFSLDGKVFHLLATHPLPPINAVNYRFRNEQLFDVVKRANQIIAAKLIIGDLNITPWSPDYARLVSQTGLRNVRQGFGILPTWPAQIPLLQIPIDHTLISNEFAVESVKVGPNIGSDHLPLLMTLSLY